MKPYPVLRDTSRLTTGDRDGNANLSSQEFISNTRRLFAFGDHGEGPHLWEHCVKATATAVFKDLAGDDQMLNIGEFESWLAEKWLGMARAQDQRRISVLTPGMAFESRRASRHGGIFGTSSPAHTPGRVRGDGQEPCDGAGTDGPSSARRRESKIRETRNLRIASRIIALANPTSDDLMRAAHALADEYAPPGRGQQKGGEGRQRWPATGDSLRTGRRSGLVAGPLY